MKEETSNTEDNEKRQRICNDGIATEMLEALKEFGINDMIDYQQVQES